MKYLSLIFNYLLIKLKKIKCHTKIDNISGFVFFLGTGKIEIENGARINSGFLKNPIGGDRSTILVTRFDGNILIKKNAGISNVTIVSHSEVVIGERTKIGGGTKIYDTDFHALDPIVRSSEKDSIMALCSPVEIGNDVFIGAHSIILKGVKVGDSSVIGAGSVVTKDIPGGQVWAGNPARFVRNL